MKIGSATMLPPRHLLIGLLSCVVSTASQAQSSETPVLKQSGRYSKTEIKRIADEVLRLKKEFPLLEKQKIDNQRSKPEPEPIDLPVAGTKPKNGEEIARMSRDASLRVGYLYLCTKCDNWHLSTAGGYAITEDAIVTCDHVLEKNTKMREGYFVAIDSTGEVAAASAVLARSQSMDVAILRMAGKKFSPVPLNRNIAQGAPAFCYSNPLGQNGYFSTGIVNRFYWNHSYRDEKPESIEALVHLRVDLSTDWAQGSSGSPILDRAGNVIAHVSTISGLGRNKNKPAPMLILHTGIPAQCVQHLVAKMNDRREIHRIASFEATSPSEQIEKE